MTAAGVATALLPLAAEARPGWGGGGWGGRGWHRDRGIDGGDVLAGILIIGGIAAIASAASNANRNQRTIPRDNLPQDDGYRYQPPRQDEWRSDGRVQDWQGSGPGYSGQVGDGQGYPQDSRGTATRGLDGAVDNCVTEASRRDEIDEIYDATRNGSGYRVSGTLRSGDNFTCEVNAQGGVLLDIRRRPN